MATYIVNQSSGLGPGGFFASATSSPPVTVTRGEATASTLRYDFSDGRYVIVTGAGFDYALGEPTAGSITGVQLFSDTNIELAAFTDVNDGDLVDFDELWMDDDDSHGVFNHLLPGSDSLIGGEGNDTLTPGLGSDIVDGGLGGTDEVAYRGGGRGNTGVTVDLDHGDPDDDIGAAWSGIGVGASALEFDTLISIENVYGSNFNDFLIGDNHDNTFSAGRGDDQIHGGGGFDELRYDRGGGNAHDAGITVTFFGEGFGAVSGGGGAGAYGQFGLDNFTGIESVRGTRFADNFTGDTGSQRFRGLGGDDVFSGGSGDDEVDYSLDLLPGTTVGVLVNLNTHSATGVTFDTLAGRLDNDTLNGIENIRGTGNADDITGDDANNSLRGEDGADVMSGGLGDDFLEGGAGVDDLSGDGGDDLIEGGEGGDTMHGGIGNDQFRGGAGADVMDGGADIDTVDYSGDPLSGTAGAVINLATGQGTLNGETDTLSFIENVLGTRNADTITGNNSANWLNGLEGNDSMAGGDGNDTYVVQLGDIVTELANQGNDTVFSSTTFTLGANASIEALMAATPASTTAMNLTGNGFANTIGGNNGANVLTGLGGNDSMNGLGGNDTLVGGLGRDFMVGGAGRDIFDFNAIAESVVGANRDTVVFSRADLDRIDLSTIDANSGAAGNQAFKLVTTSTFTAAGQIRFDAATGVLQGNVGGANGNAVDFEIKIVGVTSMLASDFIL